MQNQGEIAGDQAAHRNIACGMSDEGVLSGHLSGKSPRRKKRGKVLCSRLQKITKGIQKHHPLYRLEKKDQNHSQKKHSPTKIDKSDTEMSDYELAPNFLIVGVQASIKGASKQ